MGIQTTMWFINLLVKLLVSILSIEAWGFRPEWGEEPGVRADSFQSSQ